MKKKIALFFSRVFKIWYRLRYAGHVFFGKNVIVDHKLHFRGKGKLIIGNEVNLWTHSEPNQFFTYDAEAVVEIGNRSRINGVSIHCRKNVKIGDDCLVGSCTLLDTDFHSIYFEKRNEADAAISKPIVIGDKVWLGGQSAVLKGVSVGEGAVVGFRAVVTKDVLQNTVVAGNPAVAVKTISAN